jgi:NAD(P)-dependent dehydrogenase (short-subunit alcohol dehydrogenase family)
MSSTGLVIVYENSVHRPRRPLERGANLTFPDPTLRLRRYERSSIPHLRGPQRHQSCKVAHASVDEVAALVAFVAGPNAAYITGANLSVDGGHERLIISDHTVIAPDRER